MVTYTKEAILQAQDYLSSQHDWVYPDLRVGAMWALVAILDSKAEDDLGVAIYKKLRQIEESWSESRKADVA